MYTRMYVCIYIYISIYNYWYICNYMYVYIYIYIYVGMYTGYVLVSVKRKFLRRISHVERGSLLKMQVIIYYCHHKSLYRTAVSVKRKFLPVKRKWATIIAWVKMATECIVCSYKEVSGGTPSPGQRPPENKPRWNISFQTTKSGAGEEFLPLDCMARACAKGVVCS